MDVTDYFPNAFALVVGSEGGFTNDARDPGNWSGGAQGKGVLKGTKYGISAKSYPNEDISGLTVQRAMLIYRRDFWVPAAGDILPWPLNYLVFDTVVNQGPNIAYWLGEMQRALGTTVDGNIGSVTVLAARKAVANFDQRREVVSLFCASRAARYCAKSDPDFQRGLYKRAFTVAMRCEG